MNTSIPTWSSRKRSWVEEIGSESEPFYKDDADTSDEDDYSPEGTSLSFQTREKQREDAVREVMVHGSEADLSRENLVALIRWLQRKREQTIMSM